MLGSRCAMMAKRWTNSVDLIHLVQALVLRFPTLPPSSMDVWNDWLPALDTCALALRDHPATRLDVARLPQAPIMLSTQRDTFLVTRSNHTNPPC
jgi:hypothetical protein